MTAAAIETNKFGVPFHAYTITLSNGEEILVDVGEEDDWGDIQECTPGDDCRDWRTAVGWGNDADGHVEIVKVVDEETGRELDVREWAEKCVWAYADNYSG